MSEAFTVLKTDYVDPKNYESVFTNSLKLNKMYDGFLAFFLGHFQQIRSDTPGANSFMVEEKDGSKDGLGNGMISKSQPIVEVQGFVRSFKDITDELTSYQTFCLKNMKQQNQPEPAILERLVNSLKEYNEFEEQFDGKKDQLLHCYTKIKHEYTQFNCHISEQRLYYDKQFIRKHYNNLTSQIDKARNLITFFVDRKKPLEERVQLFESQLTQFKCKMVKNKYKVHKKISKLLYNCRYALREIIGTIKEATLQHQASMLQRMNLSSQNGPLPSIKRMLSLVQMGKRASELSSEHNFEWSTKLQSTLRLFDRQAQRIQHTISSTASYFRLHVEAVEAQIPVFRQLIKEVDSYFPQYDSLDQSLRELNGIFMKRQDMSVKMKERLTAILPKVKKARQKVRNQGLVMQSLIKIRDQEGEFFLEYTDKKHFDEMKQLFEQLSLREINDQIMSFFDLWVQSTNTALSSLTRAHSHTRLSVGNSMDASHSLDTFKYQKPRKTPLKQQIWLWKPCKQPLSINFDLYSKFFDRVSSELESLQQRGEDKKGVAIERHSCVFYGRKKWDGELSLESSLFQFVGGDKKLMVLWCQVTEIEVKSKMFRKIISVSTDKGVLQFGSFKAEPSTIVESMNDLLDRALIEERGIQLEKKKEVVMSDEELGVIRARRSKIEGDLPKVEEFDCYGVETFEEHRVDEFYDIVFSDKPFDFYGRQQPSFMHHIYKKGGNLEFKMNGFDQSGPNFYSGNEEVSFGNCPVKSTRKSSFKHPLPPIPIPFMPNMASAHEDHCMYWVSNEQFMYYIKNEAEDIPFSDCFYLQGVFHVKAEGTSVKMSIYKRFVFVKDTVFKPVLTEVGSSDADKLFEVIVGEISKLLKLRKEIERGEKVVIEKETASPEESTTPQPTGDNSKRLKLIIKVLVAGVVLLVGSHIFLFLRG